MEFVEEVVVESSRVVAWCVSCVLVLGASVGCDAIDEQVARSSGAGADAPRAKPMKLTTEPEDITVSMGGDALGQTPLILDANRIAWPMTVRVHFEEGHREFTLEEYEAVKTLAFDDGAVPSDVAVQDKAREERERRRRRNAAKVKVKKVRGAQHVNPY